MLNLIAFIFCMAGSIIQAIDKNIEFCLVDIIFAVINLPFAIKWLIDVI